MPAYAVAPVPEARPQGSRAPVALLAVAGLVVAVLVAGLVLVLTGGDDSGDDDEATATTQQEDDTTDDLSDDVSDDATSDFSDVLTDDFSDDASDDVVSDNNLRPGDCVEDAATLSSSEVTTIPCSQPHVFEVFGKFDVADGPYPGDDQLNSLGEERCTGQLFTDYVGVDYASSTVYASSVPPSRQTWEQADDRTILCVAHESGQTPTTGSYEGVDH
jgi:hypothetical protein